MDTQHTDLYCTVAISVATVAMIRKANYCNAGDMSSIAGQDLGSPIPCSMAKNKRKKPISYGLQGLQRGYWGEDLFFFFWLYHVAYGISVP